MLRRTLLLVAAGSLAACNTLGDRTTVAADCGAPPAAAPVYELRGSARSAADSICARAEAWNIRDLRVKATGKGRLAISLDDGGEPHHLLRSGHLQVYDLGLNALPDPQYATGHSIVPFADLYSAVRHASRQRPRAEPGERPGDRMNDAYDERYYAFLAEVDGERAHVPPERPGGADLDEAHLSCADLLEDFRGRRTYGPPPEPQPVEVEPESECKDELRELGNYGPPEGSVVLKVPRGIAIVADRANSPTRYYVIEDDPEITNAGVETADVRGSALDLELTSTGADAYRALVRRLAGRSRRAGGQPTQLVVVLDGTVLEFIPVSDRRRPETCCLRLDDVGGESQAARLATLIEHPLPGKPRRVR